MERVPRWMIRQSLVELVERLIARQRVREKMRARERLKSAGVVPMFGA